MSNVLSLAHAVTSPGASVLGLVTLCREIHYWYHRGSTAVVLLWALVPTSARRGGVHTSVFALRLFDSDSFFVSHCRLIARTGYSGCHGLLSRVSHLYRFGLVILCG